MSHEATKFPANPENAAATGEAVASNEIAEWNETAEPTNPTSSTSTPLISTLDGADSKTESRGKVENEKNRRRSSTAESLVDEVFELAPADPESSTFWAEDAYANMVIPSESVAVECTQKVLAWLNRETSADNFAWEKEIKKEEELVSLLLSSVSMRRTKVKSEDTGIGSLKTTSS